MRDVEEALADLLREDAQDWDPAARGRVLNALSHGQTTMPTSRRRLWVTVIAAAAFTFAAALTGTVAQHFAGRDDSTSSPANLLGTSASTREGPVGCMGTQASLIQGDHELRIFPQSESPNIQLTANEPVGLVTGGACGDDLKLTTSDPSVLSIDSPFSEGIGHRSFVLNATSGTAILSLHLSSCVGEASSDLKHCVDSSADYQITVSAR